MPYSPTDKKDSWKIFEEIAPSYDLTNRVLSLGIDRSWRKKVVSLITPDKEVSVLDLATGTGDLLLEIIRNRKVVRGVGVDMSPRMLQVAEKKMVNQGSYASCSFRIGDAGQLHFEDKEWDYVTIAFGIRNTPDTSIVLKEMHRVLKVGGEAFVLEFSLPSNSLLRRIYLLYFRYLLPLIGSLLTGRYSAYRYLNATVENYPHGKAFLELMAKAGFKQAYLIPLTFGIANIYIGRK